MAKNRIVKLPTYQRKVRKSAVRSHAEAAFRLKAGEAIEVPVNNPNYYGIAVALSVSTGRRFVYRHINGKAWLGREA